MPNESTPTETTPITETALIKINPMTDLDVQQFREESYKLLTYANSMVISSPEGVKLATDDLSIISKLKKSIELKRREYIDPISTHLAEVNQAFKLFAAPVIEADTILRSKIMDYKRVEEERVRKLEEANRMMMEAARIQAEQSGTGEISPEIVIVPVPDAPAKTIASNMGSSTTVKVRKWEVENIQQVPVEYLRVDEAQIGKLVRAGIPAIPGIRIWVEETLRINSRGE